MALTHRTATRALTIQQELHRAPYDFDFYSALRLLECAYPDNPRLGESLRPGDDPIRMGQQASMAFAPSTLADFTPPKEGRAAHLDVLFFGLFGPNGPLPLHLTDYARDRLRNSDDPTFCAFTDIFHHRLLSLFYRAWANSQPVVHFDRPETDRFSTYVRSICGYGMPSLTERDAMPDMAKSYYTGLLSKQIKNAEGLESMLSDFFQLPVRIAEFVAHWMKIPEEGRFRLGESEATGSLGLTTILGTAVWDCQSKFRVILGPLDLEDFKRFLPGGDGLKQLSALVQNYIGKELDWDLNLILKKEQIPPVQLGVEGLLGWTTKIVDKMPEKNMDEVLLNPYFPVK
jgi:type VI secretion system protein ImpH